MGRKTKGKLGKLQAICLFCSGMRNVQEVATSAAAARNSNPFMKQSVRGLKFVWEGSVIELVGARFGSVWVLRKWNKGRERRFGEFAIG